MDFIAFLAPVFAPSVAGEAGSTIWRRLCLIFTFSTSLYLQKIITIKPDG